MRDLWPYIDAKMVASSEGAAQVRRWHLAGRRVVFTNGCFDILHEGHVRYLAEARGLGDALIVGINSDESVQRMKGPTRPINTTTSRASVLASLAVVDLVIPFPEDTPEALIRELCPDVLVKGGDWTVDQIVGGRFVLDHGGEVHSLSFHQGFSTTGIVEKIQNP